MADAQTPPPPESEGKTKKPLWRRWWVIALVVVVVIAAIASGGGDDETDTAATDDTSADDSDAVPATPDDEDASGTENPESEGEAEQATSEADDITGCTVINQDNIELTGTNNSSMQSSYFLNVVFRSGGERVSDESFFINYVRPGESFAQQSFGFDIGEADSCEVVDVERSSAESPDDVSEVTCEITGTDAVGDIEGRLVATNGSSGDSDYSITAALVRDGVRIGTGQGSTSNVPPGESAPTDMLTTVDGPAEGVTCDVVHVQRTAS